MIWPEALADPVTLPVLIDVAAEPGTKKEMPQLALGAREVPAGTTPPRREPRALAPTCQRTTGLVVRDTPKALCRPDGCISTRERFPFCDFGGGVPIR